MEKEERTIVTVTEQYKVNDIPGASGIAKHQGKYWVIGDDAAVIYILNKKFKTIGTLDIPSMENTSPEGGRVSKKEKADLEAMVVVNKSEIVCFGSGSKGPQRETFIRIVGKDHYTVEEYSLHKFYSAVRQLPDMKGVELNIEAAAMMGKKLYLFNRQNNLMISLSYKDLLLHLTSGAPVPQMKTQMISTPEIDGLFAGVSGASFSSKSGRLFLTCSVENTSDAYNDGEILGSYLGTVYLDELEKKGVTWYPIKTEGEILKIESVEIKSVKNEEKDYKLVLAADNDNGKSVFLYATFVVE